MFSKTYFSHKLLQLNEELVKTFRSPMLFEMKKGINYLKIYNSHYGSVLFKKLTEMIRCLIDKIPNLFSLSNMCVVNLIAVK